MSDTAHKKEQFEAFLNLLDEDPDMAATKYLDLRERLRKFFSLKGVSDPDESADETLDRLVRKSADVLIENPYSYALGVARYVVREQSRGLQFVELLNNIPEPREDDAAEKELLSECLEKCLAKLEDGSQLLLREYYSGSKRRMKQSREMLAQSQGTSLSTLRIRLYRIRGMLRECIDDCRG